MTTQQTGQHGGIQSSAIPATPDDGTSQGRRRRRYEVTMMEPFTLRCAQGGLNTH